MFAFYSHCKGKLLGDSVQGRVMIMRVFFFFLKDNLGCLENSTDILGTQKWKQEGQMEASIKV